MPRSAATEPRKQSVREFEAEMQEARSEPSGQGNIARRALEVQGTASVAGVSVARDGFTRALGQDNKRPERVSRHAPPSPTRTRTTQRNPVTPVRPTIVYPVSPGGTEIKPPQSTPPPTPISSPWPCKYRFQRSATAKGGDKGG